MVAVEAEVWARKSVVPSLLLVMCAEPASAVSLPPSVPNCVVPPAPMPGSLAMVALPAVLASRNSSRPPPAPVEPMIVKLALLAELVSLNMMVPGCVASGMVTVAVPASLELLKVRVAEPI